MSATPYSTCTITCQNAAYTTSASVEVIVEPHSTTTSGISATDGIGRRNSMVDAVAARSTGMIPMSTPATTPSTTAIARPSSQVRTVSTTASQNRSSPICSPSVARIRLVGGAYFAGTNPILGASSS